jgi:serine/threonine protein kinase
LDAAAGGDAALVAEALLLLAADEEDDGSLEEDVRAAAAALAEDAGSGKRMGPYRVLRELGEGGMGVVYLAVRDDDAYRKRVAIKVATGIGDREEARFVRSARSWPPSSTPV